MSEIRKHNCTVFIKCHEECDRLDYCPYMDIKDKMIYKIDMKKGKKIKEFELKLTMEGIAMSGKSYLLNKIRDFLLKNGFEVEKKYGNNIKTEHQLKIKNKY